MLARGRCQMRSNGHRGALGGVGDQKGAVGGEGGGAARARPGALVSGTRALANRAAKSIVGPTGVGIRRRFREICLDP